MAGDVRATLLGVNTELALEFGGDLREDAVSSLSQLLDQDYFSVTYFDPKSRTTKTATYFCDSYDLALLYKQIGLYDTLPVTLHPVSRSS